ISTVDSYRGAQIFEVIGLGPEVVDLCFRGTASVVGGIGWDALGADVLTNHAAGELASPGFYRDRKGGEYHTHSKEISAELSSLTLVKESPPVGDGSGEAADRAEADVALAHLLQRALRSESSEVYDRFASLVNEPATTE